MSAEFGRAVAVPEALEVVLDEFLATPADGAAPGRKRLDASEYRVVLTETERGGALHVQTEDGLVPIDAAGSTALSECVRCDAGARNEDGHDHRARDVKTPPAMLPSGGPRSPSARRRVLQRDGHRCRSCRSRRSLTVHHIEFREHGGRTLPQNLLVVCARCHGLVHAGLLVIEGASAEAARFVDAVGRPLAHVEPAAAIAAPPAPPAGAPAAVSEPGVVTLGSLPAEVDAAWWRRHAHLVRDRGENGGLRFEPGVPVEVPEPAAEASAPAGEAFKGLVGQAEQIARLERDVAGCRALGTSLPHVLFSGPAGTGKTTLARGFAAAAGRPLVAVDASRPEGALQLARAARGTPREALRLLEQALKHGGADGAVDGAQVLDLPAASRALAHLGYDADDLDPTEQCYLATLRASKVPIPLFRLARSLGTTPGTLVEHVEPRLFARGFVRTVPGGRIAAPYALGAGPNGVQTMGCRAPNVRQTVAAARASP